jgi:DNA-binding XRE family transcriptional regulator
VQGLYARLQEQGALKVRRTADTRYGSVRWSTPKSGAGRSVKLTRLAVDALQRHRKRQAEERLALGALFEDQDLVFPNLSGGVIISSTLHRSFKTLLRYAGLPDVRFHALRHTAATLMLEANVNPRVVQEMLGHANIRQTMDTYSHVLPNMQQQAADRMDIMLVKLRRSEATSEISSPRPREHGRIRLEEGLSQERLAELCGMHRNCVGAIERAERTPSIVAADRIARALGTTPAEMFAEVERGAGTVEGE